MPHRQIPFRQADLARALRAAKAAGVKVRIALEPSGRIIVETVKDTDSGRETGADAPENPEELRKLI